jgi:hypothetical protein
MARTAVVEGVASWETVPEVVGAVAAPNRSHYHQDVEAVVEVEPTHDLSHRPPD